MIILPAIDLRQGKCVRLVQGELGAETVYCDTPVEQALTWARAGAEWLHVVNLDGAFAGSLQVRGRAPCLPVNLERVREMAAALDVPIEFGGGVRTLEDVELLLGLGVRRVILGTVAVQDPGIVSDAIDRFGREHIAVGLDARDGLVATHGWQQTTHVSAVDLGREMAQRGVKTVIYTDIARDGMLGGANVSAAASLAMQTGLDVIASGGVATIDDVRALCEVESTGIVGLIIGKALYTGAVSLADAIAAARVLEC